MEENRRMNKRVLPKGVGFLDRDEATHVKTVVVEMISNLVVDSSGNIV